MRWIFLAFLLVGCASKELSDAQMKKMIVHYFTPYSSIAIAKPIGIDILSKTKIAPNKVVAKICYTFRFLTSYDELVAKIKKEPNSFLAKFDVGLVALYGRKFGDFMEGEVRTRCDKVEFVRSYGRWKIKKI